MDSSIRMLADRLTVVADDSWAAAPTVIIQASTSMDEATFNQMVVAALDALPAEFAEVFQNVEVIVEANPRPQHRRAVGLKPWQTLYGLYQGVPLTERTHHYGLVAPDTITIFREPLLRDFPQPEQLRAQIRRTVLHEIAHFFGIDDDRLHELGAY
jgi:predicted Zn-dependent protease with MMP-like domain